MRIGFETLAEEFSSCLERKRRRPNDIFLIAKDFIQKRESQNMKINERF